MNCKEIETSSNKIIHVYDDLFSYAERYNFYLFYSNSLFNITGNDSASSSYRKQIFSRYSYVDLEMTGMLETEGFKFISKKYDLPSKEIHQIRVNCSNAAEDCSFHTDCKDGLTFLYYSNMVWDNEWAGCTLFSSEDLQEVEYCSFFKPGRVIVFNGSIPHMILPPNMYAKENRLSFVIQYK